MSASFLAVLTVWEPFEILKNLQNKRVWRREKERTMLSYLENGWKRGSGFHLLMDV